MNTAFLYSDRYFSYDYGTGHPLKIERLRLAYELCKAYGLFQLPHAGLVETQPASESQILRFHTPEYVQTLKLASQGELTSDFSYGLGPGDNPVFPGLWEWSQLHAGASLQCAQMICEGKVDIAFNIAGGLHHARPARASGFCYVNDPVLAIDQCMDHGKRVLYVDIDAHHGDGVQWAFYEDPRVLTISFHQDGRTLFPGSGGINERGNGPGAGYSVNIPVLPGTDDQVFWEGFRALVPRLMESFRPDVVVAQLGVDTFCDDPLAGLELTTNGFSRAVSYLTREARALLALGGGGYNIDSVARAWTIAWAIMNGVELPDALPETMTGVLGSPWPGLRDAEHKSARQDQCLRHMKECIRHLERQVLPKVVA